MKTFTITKTGVIPEIIEKTLTSLSAKTVDKDSLAVLDSDIDFIVCDLKIAHGNLNKFSKNAWFAPKNGDNSFYVNIDFR